MRAAKAIGLGTFFSFVGFIILLFISTIRGMANLEPAHAIGVSAMVAGMIEALFSPITLLVIAIAFVAATWLTRKTSESSSSTY
jgi:predicted branched-subunit amino acid permease